MHVLQSSLESDFVPQRMQQPQNSQRSYSGKHSIDSATVQLGQVFPGILLRKRDGQVMPAYCGAG